MSSTTQTVQTSPILGAARVRRQRHPGRRPIVGAATRSSARMQTLGGRLGIGFVFALALLILLALAAGLWRSSQPRLPGLVRRRTG